jgi:hypothetical protein
MTTPPHDDGLSAMQAHCRARGCPALNKGEITCGWVLIDGKPVNLDPKKVCPMRPDLAKLLKTVNAG